MHYLLETPVGIALFKKTDHLSLVSKLVYPTCSTAIETVGALNSRSAEMPAAVDAFLAEHLPASTELNVLSPDLVPILRARYNINTVCVPDGDFRKLKKNAFKWFDMNKDAYNSVTMRMAGKMATGGQADIQLVETLNIVEELEKSINNRVMRLREWYSLHFPELGTVAGTAQYLQYVIAIGSRQEYLKGPGNPDIPENIKALISNSMGVEISAYDISKIVKNAASIQGDIEYKGTLLAYLKNKCREAFPSLHCLVGEVITAKLIRKAGSLSKLAQSPSSTIQVMGAEKAFSEAVKSMGNTPKYGLIFESKIIARMAQEHRGKVARVLSNKIALCARVDLEGNVKNRGFGAEAKRGIEVLCERLEDQNKAGKKEPRQQKKKFISVSEYDQSKDSSKKLKQN